MRSIVVVYSYHHMNTEKVARVIARVLGAQVRTPQEVDPRDLSGYDLIGLGSGIYGAQHGQCLLDLASGLPEARGQGAFIFSTSAIMGKEKVAEDHRRLRETLVEKGYVVVDEFACKGFNTNSFLKYLGGMNRGQPNERDLKEAEDFAKKLLNPRDA